MRSEQLKGHLELLLLQVIDGAPLHGYQIVCAVRDRSGGTFDLPEGTIYPALHRLEKQGLLASEWDETGPRRRRVYRITADGQVALAEQRRDWQKFARGMRGVLGATA